MVRPTLVETEEYYLRTYGYILKKDAPNFYVACSTMCFGCIHLSAKGGCEKLDKQLRAARIFRQAMHEMPCGDKFTNDAPLGGEEAKRLIGNWMPNPEQSSQMLVMLRGMLS